MGFLTMGRGNGQSVFIGDDMKRGQAAETCDIRLTVMGLRYAVEHKSFVLLKIEEPKKKATMEVMLVELHDEPIKVQNVQIFFTGVKKYKAWERSCIRCGADQEQPPIIRHQGLFKFVAPVDVKIHRGDRPGRRL
jgi:hypothetical protein